VLRLLADGMSVAGIAKQLFVSESTAKTHISSCTRSSAPPTAPKP
jgi:DNA-binding NarL/FixJ family response regulator